MKIVFIAILISMSMQSFAGGTSEEVELLSLSETTENEYTLKYRTIRSGDVYTIHLVYSKIRYMFKAKHLTQEKYAASLDLLKEQLKQNLPVRFGWFGGGPCVKDKSKNLYRSDALEIDNEGYPEKGPKVVYAFCKYS